MSKKPMKAEDFVEDKLVFPYWGSPKLDGYRATVDEAVLHTSSYKPVTNIYTQELFGTPELDGLDGELIVGAYNHPRAFHHTSGPVRRKTGAPGVRWYVFDDRTRPRDPFELRMQDAKRRVAAIHAALPATPIEYLPQTWIPDRAAMQSFESSCVASGFEGIMLRSPSGPYKFGRSTLDENYLLKVKRFINEEARIIGFEEQMENLGESFKDELGRLKKRDDKNMQVGTGMIGSFIVESDKWPKPFNISASSMSHDERRAAMVMFYKEFMGELARFKYFPHGVVDVPRHGVFEACRGTEDLG